MADDLALLDRALADAGGLLDGDRVDLAAIEDGIVRWLTTQERPERAVLRLVSAATNSGEVARVATETGGDLLVLPIVLAHGVDGVLVAERPRGPFFDSDVALLRLIAGQVALAHEHARVLGRIQVVTREYLSPEVAEALLHDSEPGALGGETRQLSVLFADIQGFTTLAEAFPPDEVVGRLNRYFATAVPAIVDHGGTVSNFIGDALMALFSAPVEQPDHAALAARAGLAMQDAIAKLLAEQPGWPKFRVGVNTGPAVVGSLGTETRRIYTAVGDTVNVASRLEGIAQPGQVVIGEETFRAIAAVAEVTPLPALAIKGKDQPVNAFVLHSLRDERTALYGGTVSFRIPWRGPTG